ncbi:hypothetical protein J4E85_004171 [Alternaria conjuncta]|uniref:uncharacterized protein n=1 Tax=Alternaria conjuncta TaxID=181017 RepID=UPI002220B2FD|nr:uncharacterized protein J4E85_004171 [Alternaria conjuncta]KAI4931577.1 hypothetical protein J4E85_004171 [Alternaria conjuncta]
MTVPLEAITFRNQTESPLLRLPGELRNRIYELVVGGNIIFVSGSLQRPEKALVDLMTPGVAQKSTWTFVSGIFTIGLACRQLHRETALTQYTKNVFHFDDMQSGRAFVNGLTSTQRALLTSISVNVVDYFSADPSWDLMLSMWSSVVDTDIDMFLPELEIVYISAQDRTGSFRANEEEVLHTVGRKLKIGTSRKEGVSLMILDVFRGMENKDQAKTIKLSWNGEAFV